jgi:hypothetical protein
VFVIDDDCRMSKPILRLDSGLPPVSTTASPALDQGASETGTEFPHARRQNRWLCLLVDVWSEVGLGTEVDLKVPAAAAYATPRAPGRLWSLLFARTTGARS